MLRSYNNHENSETLVHSLMDHYDGQEVSYSKKNARSAKVIANDWLRGSNNAYESPEREPLRASQSDDYLTPQQRSPPIVRSYADIKQVLGFSKRHEFEDVNQQLSRHISLHGDLNNV